jgi:LysM repeat protein
MVAVAVMCQQSVMSGRRLLFVSLAANVALAAGCYFLWNAREAATVSAEIKVKQLSTNVLTRTKLLPVYRKQFFSWSEIESADYEQYIKNLRDIGCPEQTVRDIIVADVKELYLKKRAAAMVVTNELQWWREDFIPAAAFKNDAAKIQELEHERTMLLERLLGRSWQEVEATGRAQYYVIFDGPVLGVLTDETKQAVYAILGRAELDSSANSAKAVFIEQKIRKELATVLSPPQLEEFLLRYSDNAQNLRDDFRLLRYFDTTRDEFRSLFRATDGIETQINLLGDSDDSAVKQQKQTLERQLIAAIKAALTPARYAEYVRLQDPAYVDALNTTLALDGRADLVKTLYAVNQEVAAERTRIEANTNLTDLQRQIELKKIELAQLHAQAQATGQMPVEEPAAPTPVIEPTPPPAPTLATYSMIMGDNINALSQRYGIPMSAIRAANPGLDLDNLRPGDKIRLPEPSVRQPIAPFSR